MTSIKPGDRIVYAFWSFDEDRLVVPNQDKKHKVLEVTKQNGKNVYRCEGGVVLTSMTAIHENKLPKN